MEVENGEKSMKTTILWKGALVVSALLVFLFHILGEAAPMEEADPQVAIQSLQVTMRPLSEFLDAQGTTLPPFFPPVPNYVGWTDNQDIDKATLFALVDYAGLANDYLQGSLGTQVNGSVTQSELRDGSTQIEVALSTTNVLGFAQSLPDLRENKFKFNNTPVIFGNKATDVAKGAEAAVGESTFSITFLIAGPQAPLPDLIDVIFNNPCEFMPTKIRFTATIPGKCVNGTRSVLQVDQAGPPPVDCLPQRGSKDVVKIVSERCN